MLISLEEALAATDPERKPALLMGNGFSRSWRNEIFDYAVLLDAANFGERDVQLRELFRRLETYDFEKVMKALSFAKNVLESYGDHTALIEQIEQDQRMLKEALVTAISRTHPDRPQEVTSEQFTAARAFLARFEQVFTVNYDLLFYWARNMGDLPPLDYSTDDGFRAHGYWHGYETDQDVHFLHGGLHIYERSYQIRKHAFSRRGMSIITQVRSNLNEGRFPLFVSEPTTQKKREKIEHNPYLHYCFRALADLTGSLLVFGHSIDENDKHIFDQIKKSSISQVFISLHGDEDSEQNARTKANAMAYLGNANRSVQFFAAETANIWNPA